MHCACVIDVQEDVAAFVNNLQNVKVLGRSADLGECSGPRRPCLLCKHRCCCCGHVFSCELKLGWGGWTRTIISRVRVGFPTIERHPNRKLTYTDYRIRNVYSQRPVAQSERVGNP